MNFEKICMMFTMKEPFYGILLSAMERFPVKASECPTIGVRHSGNVFCLGYNQDFVDKLSTDTILEILKHECLHLALNHLTIFPKTDDPNEHMIQNMAMDLEANCYLDLSKIKGAKPLDVADFGFERELGALEYYKLLKTPAPPQQRNARQPSMPCNGGQGGDDDENQTKSQGGGNAQSDGTSSANQDNSTANDSNNDQNTQQEKNEWEQPLKYQDKIDQYQAMDDHSKWPSDITQNEMEQLEELVDTLMDFAAEECEKNCGTIPGEVAGRIARIRKKPKPVTDWKRYCRRYMGNQFSEFLRKSKKRESKRFPDAAGNRHKRKSRILVAIDTSGSVSMPEYREFMGQINTMTRVADFRVLECDARIQHEYEFQRLTPEILHGGGGTDFQPVIDYFNARRREFEALIYFTDGECWVPDDTPKDTLWVISSRGDHDAKKFRKNGASVVFIPKQEN